MSTHQTDQRRCRCRHTHVEGISQHEPGCPMTQKAPVVARDPYRLSTAQLLREVTGSDGFTTPSGRTLHELHGGISRETAPMTLAEAGLPPAVIVWHDGLRQPEKAANKLGRLFLSPVREVEPPTPPSIVELVCLDVRTRVKGIGAASLSGTPDALRSAYGALLDAAMDVRRLIQTRDGK